MDFKIKSDSLVFALLLMVIIFGSFNFNPASAVEYKKPLEAPSYEFFIDFVGESIPLIAQHIENLTVYQTRMTGYLGCDMVAEYIRGKFKEYGLTNVHYENYTVTVPYDYGANITILSTGEVITAYPLKPNFIQTCSIPLEGIRGNLIYIGEGDIHSLEGKNLTDDVVLMDFNSLDNWKHAYYFGAKAVVFIEPEETIRSEAFMKSLDNTPIYFPRLYVSKEDGLKLRLLCSQGTVRVLVRSSMVWENVIARNVIGILHGSDPTLNETIVISAYYDTYGIVPSNSSGAQEALGLSSLLELIRFFKQNPPRRTILFVAFSGHHQTLAGARAFIEDYLFEEEWNTMGRTIRLQVNLDLSTDSEVIGLFYIGDTYYCTGVPDPSIPGRFRKLSDYIKEYTVENLKSIGKTYKVCFGLTGLEQNLDFNLDPMDLDSEPMVIAGGTGFSFKTTNCSRQYLGTPFDTINRIDFQNLKPQLEFIICALNDILNVDELPVPQLEPFRYPPPGASRGGGFGILRGQVKEFDRQIGWYKPVQNAIVNVYYQSSQARPHHVPTRILPSYNMILKTDENGSFTIYGHPGWNTAQIEWVGAWCPTVVLGFVINSTGHITYAPDFGQYGTQTFPNTFLMDREEKFVNVIVFKSGSITLLNLMNPTSFNPVADIKVHEVATDSVPISHSIMKPTSGMALSAYVSGGAASSAPPGNIAFRKGDVVMFIPPDTPVRILLSGSSEKYPIGILLNASESNPEGDGFKVKVGENLRITFTPYQIVKDLYLLDEARLRVMRRYGITLEEDKEHSQVLNLIQEAEDALNENQYKNFYTSIYKAWNLEANVYPIVRDTILDIVQTTAFIFVFLLCFSVVAESYIFHFSGLKKILGIGVIFSVFLCILFFVHPGFHLATNAYIVMLGYGIEFFILLVPLTIFGNFYGYIREYARRKLIMREGISMTGMLSATFTLATMNMRRRKVRAALTLTSIMFITFAMVTFSSLGGAIRVAPRELTQASAPLYEGIMLKTNDWSPLSEYVNLHIESAYMDMACVVRRSWIYIGKMEPIALTTDTGIQGFIMSIQGMEPDETAVTGIDRALIEGRWFVPTDYFCCIIPDTLAEDLGVSIWSDLGVLGLKLKVVGIYSYERYDSMYDLDGEMISPRDIWAAGDDIHISSREMLIIPFRLSRTLGATIRSVVLKPFDKRLTIDVAREIFRLYRGSVYVGSEGKTYMCNLEFITTVLGMQHQMIPMIIACFVLFDTMLGNLHERIREMNVFSAVGISPFHVGMMFLGESILLAVMGSFLGYTASIVLSTLLYNLQLLTEGVFLNYASVWSMIVIFITFASVVVSSAYPFYKATKLITPSMERRWKITTKPAGDEWTIPLPFVSSLEETEGIMNFLRNHLERHTSSSSEPFRLMDKTWIKKDEKGGIKTMILGGKTHLVPYERGVQQEIQVIARQLEGQEKFSFELYMRRLTGSPHQWRTSNKLLTDDLRKQFLTWRILTPKERERFISHKEEINDIGRRNGYE